MTGPERVRLATLPTPLECGRVLPGGARLWVKRDDLTGLGAGGNKARKLEFLCAAAVADGADTLVTVGAGQSNHCRTTAAAGAVLGLDVHLVLGGAAPAQPVGNQLLSALFGATAHFAGTSSWPELEAAKDALVERLRRQGKRPYAIPIGGSTALGAVGFALAYTELLDQCAAADLAPTAIVVTSSSGGTHAGLVAGRAAARACGRPAPPVIGVAVAPMVRDLRPIERLAAAVVHVAGLPGEVVEGDVEVVGQWMGPDYAVPTAEADAAVAWAARHGAWVLDRVYTGKGFAALLGLAAAGRWAEGDDVVFWHTGGLPSVFAPGGVSSPG